MQINKINYNNKFHKICKILMDKYKIYSKIINKNIMQINNHSYIKNKCINKCKKNKKKGNDLSIIKFKLKQ